MCHRVVRFGVVVACLTLVFGVGLAGADETCNSPYIAKLIKGQEDYVYVWTLGVEGVRSAFTPTGVCWTSNDSATTAQSVRSPRNAFTSR